MAKFLIERVELTYPDPKSMSMRCPCDAHAIARGSHGHLIAKVTSGVDAAKAIPKVSFEAKRGMDYSETIDRTRCMANMDMEE